MPDAFHSITSDFSGMYGHRVSRRPRVPVHPGVLHRAFVSVEEAGTEVGAATAVVMRTESARPSAVRLQGGPARPISDPGTGRPGLSCLSGGRALALGG